MNKFEQERQKENHNISTQQRVIKQEMHVIKTTV